MRKLSTLLLVSLFVLCPRMNRAQSTPAIAAISAGLGNCSALVVATGADSKPLYGAKVAARVQYGMMGMKKLDLEAYTGVDGKLKIADLPATLKRPMRIHVSKDDKDEMVEFDPEKNCHATLNVQLQ
jgi:hypothetical protein